MSNIAQIYTGLGSVKIERAGEAVKSPFRNGNKYGAKVVFNNKVKREFLAIQRDLKK